MYNYGLIREFNEDIMEKELWVIYFESANYCEFGQHCLVWAIDEQDAVYSASDYMEEECRAQDEQQFKEENGAGEDDEDCLDGVIWSNTINIFPLSSEEGADIRRWLTDDTQKHFYPIINKK